MIGVGIGVGIGHGGGADPYGPELFFDGPMDDPSKHTVVAETSVSGGKLNGIATTASRAVAQVPNLLAVPGKRYRLVYDITDYTAGNFRFNFGGVTGTVRNTVGTHAQEITAATNGAASLIFLTGSTLSVDNVSVREIL